MRTSPTELGRGQEGVSCVFSPKLQQRADLMEKENEHPARSDPATSGAKPAVIIQGFDQWDRQLERAFSSRHRLKRNVVSTSCPRHWGAYRGTQKMAHLLLPSAARVRRVISLLILS